MTAVGAPCVTQDVHGDTLLVTIDHPPVNALSHAVREALLSAVTRLATDDRLRSMVLCSTGRVFIGGADIREFAGPRLEPHLGDVCHAIEQSLKPIVSAMQGPALGGGLEVALATHWRIASPAADVAFPEVLLGLLPGAGGTQRAPRLAGAACALEMMLTGTRLSSAEALKVGLVDQVSNDPVGDAYRWTQEQVAHPRALRRSCEGTAMQQNAHTGRDIADAAALVPARFPRMFNAPRIVRAVEVAYTQPFADGCSTEAALFRECLASDQRRALVHVFFAERDVRTSAAKSVSLERVGERLLAAREQTIQQWESAGATRASIHDALMRFGFVLETGSATASAVEPHASAHDAHIAKACVHAMVEAGHAMLADGTAHAAAEVDVASIRYAGFPRDRGGVLFYSTTPE